MSDDDSKPMTVADLKGLIADLPDDCEVLYYDSSWGTDSPVYNDWRIVSSAKGTSLCLGRSL